MVVRMAKFLLKCIVIGCIIFNYGCDVNEVANEDESKVLDGSTFSVGSDGRVIEFDEISITIPKGAFNESVNLIISTLDENETVAEAVTKCYSVKGLPDLTMLPITIKLQADTELNEESYIGIEEEVYSPTENEVSFKFNHLETIISDGKLVAEIPILDINVNKNSSSDNFSKSNSEDTIFRFLGFSNKKYWKTKNEHFKIIYSTTLDDINNVILLGEYLEEAYNKIENMKFNFSKRTKWPMIVNIEDMASNMYGLHCTSLWGINSYFLKFNRSKLGNQIELKTTAIHELFHFAEYLYDPRNVYSRAKSQPSHHWVNEAVSVWSECLVTNDQYISDVRTSNTIMKPFQGFHAGSVGDAEQHGYGMSAFVKYIVNKYGYSVLIDIYSRILNGGHPVDAINKSINFNLFMVYNRFLVQYAKGEIYADVTQDKIVNSMNDFFRIETEADSLKTFTANYPELSAKIFLVRLENQNFTDNASLEISSDQNLSHINVFEYPRSGGSLNLLANDSVRCVVTNLKELVEHDKFLIVTVMNQNLITGFYTPSSKDITVEMKVISQSQVSDVDVNLWVDNEVIAVTTSDGTWEYSYNETFFWNYFSLTSGLGYEHAAKGSMADSLFSIFYANPNSNIEKDDGGIEIVFRSDNTLDLHITQYRYSPLSNGSYYKRNVAIDYEGLPYVASSTSGAGSLYSSKDKYGAIGSEVSKVILSWDVDLYTSYDGTHARRKYISHGTCTSEAFFEVIVYRE